MISNFKSLFFYNSVYNYVSRETLNKYLTKHIEYKLIIKKNITICLFFYKKAKRSFIIFWQKILYFCIYVLKICYFIQ